MNLGGVPLSILRPMGQLSARGRPTTDFYLFPSQLLMSAPKKKIAAALRRRAQRVTAALAAQHPDAHSALHFKTPLQLLVATILSAQCTDVRVNQVTPQLFKNYPDAKAYAEARIDELERFIQSTNLYRAKARNIKAACKILVEKYQGEVPASLEKLVELPGVGRKTANVVLGNAFDIPGITVDTHVGRLSRRLAFTEHQDPEKVEAVLMELIPQADWTIFSHRMIYHGRQICHARKPKCEACVLNKLCPKIGVADAEAP